MDGDYGPALLKALGIVAAAGGFCVLIGIAIGWWIWG